MVELTLLKGTQDHLPEEQILREQIIDKIKGIFQLYGFQPAATPIIEIWDVLASKYSGGEEILKETYRFSDQGNRELGLRYDLSVPLARLVGMNPNLKKPFKRYEIGPCFRDGPIKKGRYREFIQCDADIIGVSSMLADAECLAMAYKLFTELKLDVYLEVNNRKLLTGILIASGVPKSLLKTAILTIDKLKKIGEDGVKEELIEKGLDQNLIKKIFPFFSFEGTYLEVLKQLEPEIQNNIGKEGIEELRELYHYLELFGIQNDVKLNYSLARGLEIYTGTVFEAFIKDENIISSSLCGGGRYDEIIGKFLEKDEIIPAVGISFGLETIYDVYTSVSIHKPSLTDVFIISIGTLDEAIKLATELRQNNIRTQIDLLNRNVSKNLEYADRQNIPFVIIIGKKDLRKKQITLKWMVEGKEEKLQLNKVTEFIKNILHE